MATIRLEAEYMNRTAYRLDGGVGFNFISNSFAVGLPNGGANETGTITTTFGGESGTYDIIVGYFDEDDGVADYTLNIEGALVSNWQGTNTTGGAAASAASFTTQIISNQVVNNGDVIELIGIEDLNEPARVDYIDFVLTGSTALPDIAGSNGTIEIMPLGDSVTKGTDPSIPDAQFNGYRDNLETLLTNDGFNIDLVGSRTEHGVGFDVDHEGWGGFTINQISNNVETWLGANPPEIVLLTIGTNDMRSTSTPVPEVIDKLTALVDKIMGLVPYSRLIVSSIPPVNTNIAGNTALFAQRVADFNLAIPSIINARAAAGRLISYVDAFGSIDAVANMSSDGFHPNESGYTLAANAFYSEIQAIAPSSNTPTSGDDTLTGTANTDTINGLGGNDTIDGLGGNDTLNGNAGNDTIDGGDGNDDINGGPGNDTINGRQGIDTINGGQGNDKINGGDDNDILDGVNGNDIINGGSGDDIIRGGNGRDTLRGNAGNDTLVGGNTKD
ncbi:MAG: SGNH/GDSL hydrolase family protein, partial [Cyanobacteria bacterium J06598_3]